MGIYVNPGNKAFAEIAEHYIDKTGLVRLINQTIGTENKLTCISLPRRFGKSYTAKMLAAYYDCTCDSHSLFDHRRIARTKNYADHLNKYNVIYIDVSGFVSEVKSKQGDLCAIPENIRAAIRKDLVRSGLVRFGGLDTAEDYSLNDILIDITELPEGRPFVFIIDEWDSVIREAKDNAQAQEAYLNLLRSWFKNANFTPKAVAAAYLTGILPIKKDGTQSAISDFNEFPVLDPGEFAKYTGFSTTEVKRICKRTKLPFEDMKFWYDGYELAGPASIYNPYSVMCAVKANRCQSFWGKTSAAEGLTDYIKRDFDGLQETVANLIAGSEVEVNTDSFQNDLERFGSKDDVLTLLIHLGYLTYDSEHKTVHIPNEEVRGEFHNFLSSDDTGKHWTEIISRADKILDDTIHGRASSVAAALEEIRAEQYAPQYYNNEQSLRAIIKYAYLSAIGKYIKIEEMPSGKGLADVVFIPASSSRLPALVVELKWNKTSGGALEQIKKKQYTAALKIYAGNIILCGINYDSKTGKHTCEIENG